MTDDFDSSKFQSLVKITLLNILHAALPGKGETWVRLFETRQALLHLARELPIRRQHLEQMHTPTHTSEWTQLQRQEQLVAREVPNLTHALIQQRADWLCDLQVLAPTDPAWTCIPTVRSTDQEVDRAEWAWFRAHWEAVSIQKAQTVLQHGVVQSALLSLPVSATNDPRQVVEVVTREMLRLASVTTLDIPRIPVLFAVLAILIVQHQNSNWNTDTHAKPG